MDERGQHKAKKRDVDYHSHQRHAQSGRTEHRRYQSQGHLFQPSFHSQQQQEQHFDDIHMMDPRYNYRKHQQQQQQLEVKYYYSIITALQRTYSILNFFYI